MTTLGTLGTAHTLVCDDLIVKNTQDEVKTKKILFKNGSDTLWSIGYDDETNFVLTNEHANPPVVSISASIDNGDVFIKGGGSGGASTLSELTDVTTSGVQNGEILFYNGLTSKYEFSNNLINLNEVSCNSLTFTQATIPNYTGDNLNQLYYNATTKEVTYDVIPPGASVFTVDGNFAYASKNLGFKTSTQAQTTEAVNIFGNIRFNSSNNQSRYLLCDAAFDLKASPTDTSYIEFYQNRMMGKSSNGPNTES